jgi:hypothetical protein
VRQWPIHTPHNENNRSGVQIELLHTPDLFRDYDGQRSLFAMSKGETYLLSLVVEWKQRHVHPVIRYIKQFGGRCQSCGLELTDNNYCVFDFHHEYPQEKEYMWSKLRLLSDSRIQEELAKCKLLCANCHRMAHHDQ